MIHLAQIADFQLGDLYVSPSTREVTRGDWRQIVEPRIMQVLVALCPGKVMSRDDLIALCWNGRIVSNDAIDRVIGKLRRLSEIDKGASFTIETIARVGYRLHSARTLESRPQPPQLPCASVLDIRTAALMLAMMMGSPNLRQAR